MVRKIKYTKLIAKWSKPEVIMSVITFVASTIISIIALCKSSDAKQIATINADSLELVIKNTNIEMQKMTNIIQQQNESINALQKKVYMIDGMRIITIFWDMHIGIKRIILIRQI